MSTDLKNKPFYWKTQKPVDYLDNSLVQNTWENVVADLSGGKPTKLWYIIVKQTNNGATDEDIEFEITINGVAHTFSATCVSGTEMFCFFNRSLAAGTWGCSMVSTKYSCNESVVDSKAVPFTAETVGLIRVRQTSDVDGVSAQIEVNIVWDKLTRAKR